MFIKTLTIQNYRNFGEPAFVLPLRQFTLVLGENNVGKTNLLNALCLLMGQELSVAQSRTLQLDDFNYESVTRFRKHVADPTIAPEDIVFPEVIVDATLTGMNEDQEAVVGDWFSDATLEEAKITYRFSIRSSFDRKRWIEEQRELLASLSDAFEDVETPQNCEDDEQTRSDDHTGDSTFWNRVEFPLGEYRHIVYGGGRPSNECDSHFLRMLKVELLDALRDARRELIASGEQRLLYRILRQGHHSKYTDLKESLLALEECVKGNSALKGIKEEVEKLLERVSLVAADGDNSIDFNFSSPDATELLKKIGMVYGINPINVERNGLGRNNLLYIALVLSQLAKPTSGDLHEDSPTCFRVVGIEEPEAHLHPHLQDHLARNIESVRSEHDDKMQLILTSHSTHIASRLSLENTVILFTDSESERLSSHYILEGLDHKKEKDAVRFLSLYLDATKSRMFFARRLILVEGIAEQTLIPRMFQKYKGESLERHSVTVLNVNGVAFRHFLKVIKNGYFLKCVVLTDSDAGTAAESRPFDLKTDFDDGTRIQVEITEHETTFEKELIAANKQGEGKKAVLSALKATRSIIGKQIETDTGKDDLDVESVFDRIEEYKAAFAFNLAQAMDADESKLTLPTYIQRAFDFVV